MVTQRSLIQEKNISDEIDAGSYDVVVPLVSQLIEQLGGVE